MRYLFVLLALCGFAQAETLPMPEWETLPAMETLPEPYTVAAGAITLEPATQDATQPSTSVVVARVIEDRHGSIPQGYSRQSSPMLRATMPVMYQMPTYRQMPMIRQSFAPPMMMMGGGFGGGGGGC